jgi:hypothetical protein
VDRNEYRLTIDVANADEFPINIATRRINDEDEGTIWFVTDVGKLCIRSAEYKVDDVGLCKIDKRYANKGSY